MLVLVGIGACKPDVGEFVTRAGAGSGGTAAGTDAEARGLGVHTLRATADLIRLSTLALGRQLHDMGFDIVLTVRANDLGPNGATMALDATGIETFRTQLADAIGTVHPKWVMVENEETAPKFYAGTAAQYLDGYNRLTDLPIVTTEIGQYNGDPATVTAFLDVLTVHHVRLVPWSDTDGDPAVGLHDAPGVLRPNGVAFADWSRTPTDRRVGQSSGFMNDQR